MTSESDHPPSTADRFRQLLGRAAIELPTSRLQTDKKSATVSAPAPVRIATPAMTSSSLRTIHQRHPS